MIILIPLGGTGERFKKEGYKNEKALIKVNNKEIIYNLIDNLNIKSNISFIYIPYNKIYKKYNFEELIRKRYPKYKFKFFVINNKTKGAAETIHLSLLDLISNEICYPISFVDQKNNLTNQYYV